MPRHSKNNTNASHFTSGERKMLADRWGSKSGRLGSDSIRKYDQCSLCLDQAYSPVVCNRGHLTCRECALTDYVHQMDENAKRMRELEELERRFEQEREAARQDARRKVLLDFERNSGASSSSLAPTSTKRNGDHKGSDGNAPNAASVSRARSRSRAASPTLSTLPARIAEATRVAEEAAAAALAEEQALAARAQFPSYWVPSLTPSFAKAQLSAEELEAKRKQRAKLGKPRCLIGGQPGHETSVKQLVDVKFTRSPDGERNICPSCRKGLSNASHLHVLRRCGHVYCAICISTLVPSLASPSDAKRTRTASGSDDSEQAQCLECDVRIKDAIKDVLKLHKEGTGHVGAGGVEVTKKGLAFLG